MGRSILSQLINKPGKKKDESDKNKKRRERAAKFGPPSLADKINPFKVDDWAAEKQNRREEAKKQYFKDKQRLYVKERHARTKLKTQLINRKNTIDAHYRVGKLKKSDPRLEKARRNASRNFGRYAKKTEHKHREQWQKSYRNLKSQRNKQYRLITKTMKKEHRRDRGLPDEMQTPWKF